MGSLWKSKFWIGVALAVGGIITCYCAFAIPTQQLIRRNTSRLRKTKSMLEDLAREGSSIATDTKINKCKTTRNILEKEHSEAVGFFLERSVEAWSFWPDVVDVHGVPNGALFKDRYEEEIVLLEEELAKDVRLSPLTFPWVRFGDRVPPVKECYPIMRDFCTIREIVELIRSADSVELLESLQLGNAETQVLDVRGVSFCVRSLTIKAYVRYPRLLFLLAKLQNSPRNIYIDTISISRTSERSAVDAGEDGTEPPVFVVLNCSMLRAAKPSKDEEG